MTNPYDKSSITYVVDNSASKLPFNPELMADGESLKLVAASALNEVMYSRRLEQLLKRLIWDDHIDINTLNEIGFSKDDANSLGLTLEGLENINVPSDWQDHL